MTAFDYRRFSFAYEFAGSRWCGEVWATTHEEAEMKLRAMGQGVIDGVITDEIDAEDADQ